MLMDKVMRPLQEIINVTSPRTVWVEDNPMVEEADKGKTLVKKRGIIPDGLVQRRLDYFIVAFPNLRGGGWVWMVQ